MVQAWVLLGGMIKGILYRCGQSLGSDNPAVADLDVVRVALLMAQQMAG